MDVDELNRAIEEKRQAAPAGAPPGQGWQPGRRREPEALGRIVDRVAARLDAMPALTTEERERQRREQQGAERSARWRSFSEQLGARYAGCRFANFEIPDGPHAEAQGKVLNGLRRYAEKMPKHVEAGRGVLLPGPSGTGKDHLVTALSRVAILRFDLHVRWIDSTAFYCQMRDRLDSHEREAELIERFCLPTILYISDPVPPHGALTAFQAAALFAVIDRRYRDRRPTWMTLNVQNFDEMGRRLGASIADRLKDNSLTLRCAWPSFRKPC